MNEKICRFSNGQQESEERTIYALSFLEVMEEQFGTDFVQAPQPLAKDDA